MLLALCLKVACHWERDFQGAECPLASDAGLMKSLGLLVLCPGWLEMQFRGCVYLRWTPAFQGGLGDSSPQTLHSLVSFYISLGSEALHSLRRVCVGTSHSL